MLLFENFTYNGSKACKFYTNTWACVFYDDYYHTCGYFKDLLNENNESFYVKCIKKDFQNDADNSIYEVTYTDKSDIFKESFPKEKFDYALNILKNYGNGLTILPETKYSSDDQCAIFFKYDICKDEYRWNKEHEKVENELNAGNFEQYDPSLEQWIYMLNAKTKNKDPKLLFNKLSSVEDGIAKFIIIRKLNWSAADSKIRYILETKFNIEYRTLNLLQEYADIFYKPDEIIQELIIDALSTTKNNDYVPSKYIKIAQILDNNMLVSKYHFDENYSYNRINIVCSNGKKGKLYIDEDGKNWKGTVFYILSVALEGDRQGDEESVYPCTLPALIKYHIEPGVNAIYYQDKELINKVTIKIKP